ncbi:MAG: SUMF1/EgtB/PvdO family nonheme iron enzyme [Pyrinomonadaceae bacterium]|nr:SUMF1/EgtB/PvdO family nonheme iron enzyme [Pyrinomonadaceae bacterium]
MRDDAVYLRHIAECVRRIEDNIAGRKIVRCREVNATRSDGVKDMTGNVMEWTSSTFKLNPNNLDKDKTSKFDTNTFAIRGLSFGAEKEKMEKPPCF